MKENFCCESNGSQAWLPLQVKFETEAQILAIRLACEAAGDLANTKFFFHLFAHTFKKRLRNTITFRSLFIFFYSTTVLSKNPFKNFSTIKVPKNANKIFDTATPNTLGQNGTCNE